MWRYVGLDYNPRWKASKDNPTTKWATLPPPLELLSVCTIYELLALLCTKKPPPPSPPSPSLSPFLLPKKEFFFPTAGATNHPTRRAVNTTQKRRETIKLEVLKASLFPFPLLPCWLEVTEIPTRDLFALKRKAWLARQCRWWKNAEMM